NKNKLPRAIAVVDFEHWYIALERGYGIKPDIKAWSDEIRAEYDVEEMAFFGDFSNSGLRGEIDKIRTAGGMVINTQNSSESYEKDFTDFIMLDYIYQKAMTNKKTDTFVIFTGDGHFSSVVRFIINICRKKVGIYGVKNAISYQLKESASYFREVPKEAEAFSSYYKMIANRMSYLMVHREAAAASTEKEIVAKVSEKHGAKRKTVALALEQMIKQGYLYKATAAKGKSKKAAQLKADWEKLERDGIWEQP
ncbi:MAG: NYN domain-containing protein, partial [Clostridia bacterium]|nr:NYN domain-containing protein [Clostridia bacterium]